MMAKNLKLSERSHYTDPLTGKLVPLKRVSVADHRVILLNVGPPDDVPSDELNADELARQIAEDTVIGSG
jgi:hypothetical protein